MENVQKLINKTIAQLKKKYEVIGEGRNRIVFIKDEKWVIKCPLNEEGLEDNYSESKRFAEFGKKDLVVYAECHISHLNDIPLLTMERAYPIKDNELPEWSSYVDGGQVGKTLSGEIVAYDFA